MRVLVTGAAGQLGGELLGALRVRGHESIGHTRADGDLAAPGAAAAALRRHRPDAVVNCAAFTAVDRAEAEPEAAHRANAVLPGRLAEACAGDAVALCHLSTDYVFDGTATVPVGEAAPTKPLGVYGRTKLEGEVAVRGTLPAAQVVRTAWLFGRSGPNFVLTMLRLARERGSLRVVADQVGSPTWTGHLAPALVRLLERGDAGTFHLVNAGQATWCELAQAALASAGLGGVPVQPIATADYPTPAPRPVYSVLSTAAWQALGEPALPPWQEAVSAYVASLP